MDRVDTFELVDELADYFGGWIQRSRTEVAFPNDGPPDLILRFNAALDRCIEAKSGRRLTQERLHDIEERVQLKLLAPGPRRVGAEIVFCDRPIKGYWRSGDQVRLLPTPPGSPKSVGLMGPHPALLEFRYEGSEDRARDIMRRQQAAAVWSRRLNLFVMPGLVLRDNALMAWVLSPLDRTIIRAQKGYWYDGLYALRDTFTSVDDTPALEVFEDADFYREYSPFTNDFVVPKSLNGAFDALVALSPESLMRADRAGYWFQQSEAVGRRSQSMRFAALINGVESLITGGTATERCPQCERLIAGEGPSGRFNSFLELHVGRDGELARLYRDLYDLRSRLAHGGVLLQDSRGWGSTPRVWDEERLIARAQYITRLAVRNWVLESRDARRQAAEAQAPQDPPALPIG